IASDLPSIETADLAIVEPVCGMLEAFERIIDGVQNAIAANLQHRREERRRAEVSACRYIHVLAEIFSEGALAGDAARRLCDHVIDPPDVERNALAAVPKDNLQIRTSIEKTRRHQPQCVRAGFHRESPSGRGQPGKAVEDRLT